MRNQEGKIELQKKVHRRNFVRDIWYHAILPMPFFVTFFVNFNLTPKMVVMGGGGLLASLHCSPCVYVPDCWLVAIFKFSHFKFTLKFINQLINIGSLSRDRLQILLLILIKFKSKLMNFYPPEIIRKRTGF